MEDIEWAVEFSDAKTRIGIGGQIKKDGKIYRHAIYIDKDCVDKAKAEIEKYLTEKINGG